MSEGLIVVLRKCKEQIWGVGYFSNPEKGVIGYNEFVRTVSTKLLHKSFS